MFVVKFAQSFVFVFGERILVGRGNIGSLCGRFEDESEIFELFDDAATRSRLLDDVLEKPVDDVLVGCGRLLVLHEETLQFFFLFFRPDLLLDGSVGRERERERNFKVKLLVLEVKLLVLEVKLLVLEVKLLILEVKLLILEVKLLILEVKLLILEVK
jgi:hypothetical protein